MSDSLMLPYGRRPISIELPESYRPTVVSPPTPPDARDLGALIDAALDQPIGCARLEDSAAAGERVLIIVSDATRDDPRDAMVRALLARLPADIELTLAVANGTHGPSDLDALGIGEDVWRRAAIVNHNAHDDRDMVTVGTTQRGTPVRLHRCAVAADRIIATGRIKPHYFAGYGAGCKAIFPGLGSNREIRINHRLKSEPGSRPGRLDDNPCRLDLEEAAAMLPAEQFLLNIVLDHDGGAQAVVAGELTRAFRAGAAVCERLYRVRAPRASVVIVSDGLPLTGSLYQASKLVAAAAELLVDGGVMIVIAECPDGIGPVETVNRAIYEIGLAPRLPANHEIVLISSLERDVVAQSYCTWAPSLEAVLSRLDPSDVTIVPRAGALIIEPVA